MSAAEVIEESAPSWPEGALYFSDRGLYSFQEEGVARAYLQMENGGGMMACWDTGCIYGDAEIIVNRGGASRRYPLRQVVHMFNGGKAVNGHTWDLNIPTMVQREVDGVVRLVSLAGAWESGVKQTYIVTTDSGRTIRATDEHPFLTERGWLRLDQLEIGDQVHVRGEQTWMRGRLPKQRYKMVSWLKHHPYATHRTVDRSPFRVAEHRLVAEARMNRLSLADYIARLRKGPVAGVHFLDPEVWAVHHIDHNHLNNAADNLKVITHSEHHRLHAGEGKTCSVLYKVTTERVASVEPYGEEMTYDLSVPDDPHNFLADGFVVHNTGKSHLAMALAALYFEDGLIDHVLLVAEKNKIGDDEWLKDFRKFTRMSAMRHHGTGRMERLKKRGMPQVLVTTYETGKVDLSKPVKVPGKRGKSLVDGPLMPLLKGKRVLVVMDESTKVANRGSDNFKAWKRTLTHLRQKAKTTRVLQLTATPIETGWENAYNQLHLAHPKAMPRIGEFEDYFIRARDAYDRALYHEHRMHEFAAMAAPLIMRKRKSDPDVIAEFPKQVEEARWFDLGDDHFAAYEFLEELQQPGEEPVPGLWQVLRQLADHPEAIVNSAANPQGSALSKMLVEELGRDYFLGMSSVKEAGLLDYLEPIVHGQGAKAVVFSFFGQSVIPPLERALRKKKFRPYVCHGGMSMAQNAQTRMDFRTDGKPCVLLTSDVGSRGVNLPEATYVCVAADTPVLTNDLRWVPAGTLQSGDGVMGCDEMPTGQGRAGARRWRLGTVVRNQVEPRECVRVTLSNGDSMVVTPEHRMLIRGGQGVRWEYASRLKPCHKVLKYYDMWEPDTSYDAGWLAGIFDGEGWFSSGTHCRGTMLAMAQNPGFVLDKVRSLVMDGKFQVREHGHPEPNLIRRFHITGGRAEQTRFLGTYRPIRLIEKWQRLIPKFLAVAIEHPSVVSVEPAGVHDVAIMETSTKTFVGAGYMHHNCEYESALTYANRTQRINRIHRIDSQAESVTCMTFFARDTVEQKIFNNMLNTNRQTDTLLGDEDAGEHFMSAADRREALSIARQSNRQRRRKT